MAFGWGSSAVSVVVTVVGQHGDVRATYYASLASGDTTTIAVPDGAAAVTLSRHVRQRVRLSERGGGRTASSRSGHQRSR